MCDLGFFFGDLNYRLNSDFEYLNSNLEETKKKKLDQLYITMNKDNNFVCYEEGEIKWYPTYKLSHTEELVYVNKKNQAHSYTDRILFRNNSINNLNIINYTANHSLLGSDHRPVQLDLSFPLRTY